MTIIMKDMRQRNAMAFSDHLWCPVCSQDSAYKPSGQKWRLDKWITPVLIRYICKKCGTPIRYDISNRLNARGGDLVRMGGGKTKVGLDLAYQMGQLRPRRK